MYLYTRRASLRRCYGALVVVVVCLKHVATSPQYSIYCIELVNIYETFTNVVSLFLVNVFKTFTNVIMGTMLKYSVDFQSTSIAQFYACGVPAVVAFLAVLRFF